jgi:hypothetical protein
MNSEKRLDEMKQMEQIRFLGRKMLRAAAVLSAAGTIRQAYDANHAVEEIAEQLGFLFDQFEPEALGFGLDNHRHMVPVETSINEGQQLLKFFSVRLCVTGYSVSKAPMPDLLKLLACDQCGNFLTVEGACPDMADTDEFHQQGSHEE